MRDRGVGERGAAALGAQRGLLGEVAREQRDVAGAVAQRRHLDRDHREPVVEILAERAAP